jgi:hypothetical protein
MEGTGSEPYDVLFFDADGTIQVFAKYRTATAAPTAENPARQRKYR